MTARDRLLAELWPTGRFGRPPARPWTAAEQAAHRAELAAAVCARRRGAAA